jgi:hypothetical protein
LISVNTFLSFFFLPKIWEIFGRKHVFFSWSERKLFPYFWGQKFAKFSISQNWDYSKIIIKKTPALDVLEIVISRFSAFSWIHSQMECQSGNLVEYLFLWILCVTSDSWHLSQVSWVEWDTSSKATLGTYQC